MTEIQRIVFDYLLENQLQDFLPPRYFTYYSRVTGRQKDTLLETMTDQQQELFEAYQKAQCEQELLEQQALFQAAWAAAHELLCP